MELKALETYRCPEFDFLEGGTTLGRDEITEAKKKQMVTDFPDSFKVLTDAEIKAIRTTPPPAPAVAETEPVPAHDPFAPDPSTIMRTTDDKEVGEITTKEELLDITVPEVTAKKKRK